ncbi:MAG: site-2 protease family protein [Opitutaceae bacterium]|jgi:Zn-dependent protease
MNLFRIRGIQLSIHWSFAVLLGYVAWEGWTIARWQGALWSVGYMLALFACVTLHELGHATAARRFGVRVPRILLLPIGGMAEMDSIPRQPREEIIIALAGPAVNYVLIGLLMIFVRFPAGWNPAYFSFHLAELGRHLVLVNLIMGVFNLLPAFPMDGGRVFRALLARKTSYLRATKIAAGVGKVVALAGAGFLIYNGHYMGGVLFGFIIFAGERELRATARMEMEEAHWRQFQSRFQPPLNIAPSEDFPPRVI